MQGIETLLDIPLRVCELFMRHAYIALGKVAFYCDTENVHEYY